MKFGLENMRALCAALDHPESAFRSVIVAGTNGKGSVSAMLSKALHAGGYRVGRYTSPHLERIEERFVIGEEAVDSGELERAAAVVRETVERLLADGTLAAPPTFFECATAIGFELFRRAGVTIAVVEVGLGGRLDATNVLTPVAAAITTIGLDHQELLGDTLPAIAREKAGVIKPGITVVVGRLPNAALAVVAAEADRQGARLVRATEAVDAALILDRGVRTMLLRTRRTELVGVLPALAGRHQVENAAVALCVMEALGEAGFELTPEAMRAGFERVRWPGRLERVSWRGAEIVLDAAHNPDGARSLAAYLEDEGWTGVTLVIGVMADKDVRGIVAALTRFARVIVCTTPPSPRAMPAATLAALVAESAAAGTRIEAIDDPAAALAHACLDGARVVAAGSIFLLGPLRGILR